MVQEKKDLLLQDICARLLYGVYVLVHDTFEYSTVPYENVYLKSFDIASLIDSISLNERYNSRDKRFNRIIKERKDFLEFKPYLRSMSSMTEEEKKEFHHLASLQRNYLGDGNFYTHYQMIDWLDKNMFDYRGLIRKGLAIEAPEGMYEY